MKLKVILLFIFALTSCESKLPYPWLTDIELEQVFKIAGEKLVLIDFETEWWTWCDRLDVDTFNDDKIKKEMVTEFIDFYGKNIANESKLINGAYDFLKWCKENEI